MRRIHFAYTVPRRPTVIGRAFDKFFSATGITPPYRLGSNTFIPWSHPIRAPHSISYHLLQALKQRGKVRYYSLYEHGVAHMRGGDVFIGQPVPDGGFNTSRPDHDDPLSVTSRTLREFSSFPRTLIMPYAHDELLVSWAKDLVTKADTVIFIGGEIWKNDWNTKSPFRDITIKNRVHVEMGIDSRDYPVVKNHFNPKGKRKYLYIGHTAWYKNTAQLEEIAKRLPNFDGAHIGGGEVQGWKKLANFATLTPEYMRKLAQEYDIFVTTSTADAQATTILEQMCFGMAVACTPETGYTYDSITKLSTSDVEHNIRALTELQEMDENELLERSRENLHIAQTRHTWSRFCHEIVSATNL